MQSKHFKLLESFGLKNGSFIAYTHHLERISRSADFFQFKIDLDHIHTQLESIRQKHPKGMWKIRLLSDPDGHIELEIDSIAPLPTPIQVQIAHKPIQRKNTFLYHKTTERHVYQQIKKDHPHVFDVLLWNEANEITEFTIGNVVFELNDTLYTPSVQSGLLAGTYRQQLIDEGVLQVKTIYQNDITPHTPCWLINSVREWVPVTFR